MSRSADEPPAAQSSRIAILTIGRSATVFADQLVELLILWFVWELSRSSTVMGIATFAGRAPFWLFAFYGATLVDRFGPLRLLTVCNAIAAVIAAAMAIKLFLFGTDVVSFVLLAFALNGSRSLEAAALTATVPLIVGQGSHQSANSWFDNAKRIGRLSAPMLSRWMGLLHPGLFVALAATAYGLMAAIAAHTTNVVDDTARRVRERADFRAAFAFVERSRPIALLIGLSGVYSFFHGIAYFVVLPRLSFDLNQDSPSSLGVVITLVGVGGILSNLAIARVRIHRHLGAVGCGMVAAGVCFALFATEPPTWVRYILALMAGASLPFQDVFITCAIQVLGPMNIVARLHATWRLACEFTISLGLLAGGVAVDLTSASLVGLSSGVVIVLAGSVLIAFRNEPPSGRPPPGGVTTSRPHGGRLPAPGGATVHRPAPAPGCAFPPPPLTSAPLPRDPLRRPFSHGEALP